MKKGPFTDDYGGNSYHKGRKRIRRTGETHESYRCDSCGHLQYETKLAMTRATRPRCRDCGGLLIESDSEASRHKADRMRVIDTNRYRCRACGDDLLHFSPKSLALHLCIKTSCIQHFLDAGLTFKTIHKVPITCVYGTAYMVRHQKSPSQVRWRVHAVSSTGELIECCEAYHQYIAAQYIRDLTPMSSEQPLGLMERLKERQRKEREAKDAEQVDR